MTRIVAVVSLVISLGVVRLDAQCPNGAPPPCVTAAPRPVPANNSIAVLFFEARDTADAYLADGLTEDVTSLLGNVASVQVKSPGMVRRAQRISPDNPPAIARSLGVRYLLDGNVRRIGSRVRVSTRLLNGTTAIATWGDVFDRTPDELLALPALIARQVAARVGGPLASGANFGTPRTNPAAYDHYLRGNFALSRRSPQGIERALQEYQEAERLDSGFAGAIGRAAYAYAIARFAYFPLSGIPVESLAIRGLAVADRALRRDSGSSDAWMARASLLAFANPRALVGSTQAFERAIALDPRNAEAHHQYAQVLNWLNRHEDAGRELHLALTLDPGRVVSYTDLAGWTVMRDTALALTFADSAVTLDPTSAHARRSRGLARLRAGDLAGAMDDAELANRLQPGNIGMEGVLALVRAHGGDAAGARALIAHWTGSYNWLIGAALATLGDTTAALDQIEQLREPGAWAALLRPEFDGLHGNARYEQLVVAMRPEGAVGP